LQNELDENEAFGSKRSFCLKALFIKKINKGGNFDFFKNT
tara:strand:- start:881 stop:1000 length:120 start_codon:yes stop_codon:yes gene_type:complete